MRLYHVFFWDINSKSIIFLFCSLPLSRNLHLQVLTTAMVNIKEGLLKSRGAFYHLTGAEVILRSSSDVCSLVSEGPASPGQSRAIVLILGP